MLLIVSAGVYTRPTMTLRITVHLVNGTCDCVEVHREMGRLPEFMMDLHRDNGFWADNTYYPLHAIVKLKFGDGS